MSTIGKVDVEGYWRDGYTVVRNVYTRDEIQDLRERSLRSQKEGLLGGDLLSNPLLKDVVLDGRMLEVARRILGHDDIVYYGDSTVAIREGQPHFHKDNADREDGNAPDWTGRYTQIRFGIYLQDHYRHSGGLNVRVGSHNLANTSEGRVRQLRTRVGDLGVWNMRISHSAAGTLLRFPRWIHPHYQTVPKIPDWLIAPKDGQRIAIFSALGADDAHLKRYLEYMKTRKYVIDSWQRSQWSDELLEEAAQAGLKIRNAPAEIIGDDSVGKNVNYAPIPY